VTSAARQFGEADIWQVELTEPDAIPKLAFAVDLNLVKLLVCVTQRGDLLQHTGDATMIGRVQQHLRKCLELLRLARCGLRTAIRDFLLKPVRTVMG
jgi:hypothetical protein